MLTLLAVAVIAGPWDHGYFLERTVDKPPETQQGIWNLHSDGVLALTLTVRGGISLGSYEAGYDWALLRLLRGSPQRRPVSLRALSGASAGNINVFLGAIDWFEETPTTIEGDGNLLWKAWINVGLPQLLPPLNDCKTYRRLLAAYDPLGNALPAGADDPSCEDDIVYDDDDGILSRHAFARIYAHLQARLRTGGFRSGPPLDLGVSLTLTQPQIQEIGNITVPTQRAFTTLTASVAQGQLDFVGKELAGAQASLGIPVYLDAAANNSLNGAVQDIATASSAFPIAFGPKELCVHTHALADRGKNGVPAACQKTRFLDGGVFDNAPVRLAQTLAHDIDVVRRVSIDVDPDLGGEPDSSAPPPRHGLEETLSILGGAISTARKAEMLNIQDTNVLTLSRSVHVYGEHLGAFAAFIARTMRRYDYYVGVYDAARALAFDRCYHDAPVFWLDVPPHDNPPEKDDCYFATMAKLYNELGVFASDDAAYVFLELMNAEMRGAHAPQHMIVITPPKAVSPALKAIAGAMQQGPAAEAHGSNIASVAMEHDQILGLLQRIADDKGLTAVREHCASVRHSDGVSGEDDCIEVDELDAILRDVDGWAASRARAALSRMYEVERQQGYALGEKLVDVAQFVFEQDAMPRRTGLRFETTVPYWSRWNASPWRWTLWLVPTIIDLHFKDGGGALRYVPAWSPTQHFALIAPLTPLWWQRDLQAPNSWRVMGTVGLGAQWKTGWLGLSTVELDVHYLADIYNRADHESQAQRLSGELGMYFADGKIHTALQCGAGPAFSDPGLLLGRNCLVKLGLADLPGIVYWAARLGH